MATKLKKVVRRESLDTLPTGKHRGRALTIELIPPYFVKIRVKGTRASETTTILECYSMAQRNRQAREYRDRLKQYNNDKADGKKRLRKPLKPFPL